MPLYKILCKLKIEEMGVVQAVLPGKYGARANPVYKEIRETIKLIAYMWKSIGLGKGGDFPSTGAIPFESDNEGGYYTQMEKSHQASKKKARLIKRQPFKEGETQ
jgi:hypothetical protein